MTTNYKFDTYRGKKKGEIILECKTELSALNKIKRMSNLDLKESIDNEKEVEITMEANLLIFYNGNLVRKI
jgi:hypothetical protein